MVAISWSNVFIVKFFLIVKVFSRFVFSFRKQGSESVMKAVAAALFQDSEGVGKDTSCVSVTNSSRTKRRELIKFGLVAAIK